MGDQQALRESAANVIGITISRPLYVQAGWSLAARSRAYRTLAPALLISIARFTRSQVLAAYDLGLSDASGSAASTCCASTPPDAASASRARTS